MEQIIKTATALRHVDLRLAYTTSAIFWLVIGLIFFVVEIFGLSEHLPIAVPPGRLSELGTQVLLWGWSLQGLLGSVYGLLTRDQSSGVGPPIPWISLGLINAGVAFGSVYFFAGIQNAGFHYLRFIWPIMLIIVSGLGLSVYHIWSRSRSSISSVDSFILFGLLSTPCLVVLGAFPFPLNGASVAVLDDFISHHLFWFGFFPPLVGLFVHELATDCSKTGRWGLLFWLFVLSTPFTVIDDLSFSTLPLWLQNASVYLGFGLPVACFLILFYGVRSSEKRRLIPWGVFTGVFFLALFEVLSPIFFTHSEPFLNIRFWFVVILVGVVAGVKVPGEGNHRAKEELGRWRQPVAGFVGVLVLSACGFGLFPVLNISVQKASVPQMTDSERRGLRIYVQQGCPTCHSQQVKSFAEDAPGLPTIANDFIHIGRTNLFEGTPNVVNAQPTGPNLANIGVLRPSKSWHLRHLYNPEIVNKASEMPAYPHLFRVEKYPGHSTVVDVPDDISPDNKDVVATQKAIDLVAYLKGLKQRNYTETLNVRRQQTTPKTELGRQVYDQQCARCHKPDGQGAKGIFPPLVNSRVVNKDNAKEHIEIILNGLSGKTINGINYPTSMPPFRSILRPKEIKAVVNYERTSWGNTGETVDLEDIQRVIEQTQ
jgi:cytochrome c oxidase cbb3-type subunit 2